MAFNSFTDRALSNLTAYSGRSRDKKNMEQGFYSLITIPFPVFMFNGLELLFANKIFRRACERRSAEFNPKSSPGTAQEIRASAMGMRPQTSGPLGGARWKTREIA